MKIKGIEFVKEVNYYKKDVYTVYGKYLVNGVERPKYFDITIDEMLRFKREETFPITTGELPRTVLFTKRVRGFKKGVLISEA